MKKIKSLIFLVLLLLTGITMTAQDINLQLDNVSKQSVLEKIQKDYGYSFSISTSDVDISKKISISVRNARIEDVLQQVFAGDDVTCRIDGKIISVTKKESDAPGKPVTVSGTVLDADGLPIVGVAVIQKGTSTDVDGKYLLVVSETKAEIEFSCIGYQTLVYAAESVPGVVNLKEDALFLDDVVVVGYGNQRREFVTNAITSFKPDEDNGRTALTPTELLQGRVAGVSVASSSGNLGTSERISIRGSSSLSASNSPLYVVDGIPLNNESGSLYNLGDDLSAMSVLNLTDIESIEILKDAASSAIYGSRATNGVILITTKQGKEGKSDIKVNYSFGISEFANRNRIRYADSDTWITVYNEGIDNYNRQNGYTPGDASYVQHIRNPYNGLEDTDWLDVITRLGMSHSVDVSFAGGTSKTKAYIAANYNYQEGVIKTNDITKVNLKANVSHQVARWLNVGANMSGNFLKNNRVPGATIGSTIIGRAVEQRPFDRPFKPDGGYYLGGTDELSRHNPVQILSEQRSFVDNYRFLGSLYAEATIIDGLKAKVSFNNDTGYTYDYLYYNANHPYKEDNGRVIDKNRFMISNLFEAFVTYDKTWGDFAFGAMAGHSFQKTSMRTSSIDAQNFPSPSFNTVGVAANVVGVSGGLSEYAMESWYGRVNLAYKERYILDFSRFDLTD